MILAILQARVSSSRLPGKVLKEILGEPMLYRQIERVQRSCLIDKLVIATSIEESDNPIDIMCRKKGVTCFRGSLNDVLDRFYQTAAQYQPEHIVRLTGDCPLADPEIIDSVINYHVQNEFEYTSNVIEPTFPDGLDVEVFSLESLKKAWQDASLQSEREHVTPYIYNNPCQFKIGSYKCSEGNYSHFRWTVDEQEDFLLIARIYAELYPDKPDFNMYDIMRLLKNDPELIDINNKYKRNEGYQKSLQHD